MSTTSAQVQKSKQASDTTRALYSAHLTDGSTQHIVEILPAYALHPHVHALGGECVASEDGVDVLRGPYLVLVERGHESQGMVVLSCAQLLGRYGFIKSQCCLPTTRRTHMTLRYMQGQWHGTLYGGIYANGNMPVNRPITHCTF